MSETTNYDTEYAKYLEAKTVFESWKVNNSRQEGTDEYNEYIASFESYETEMLCRLQSMRAGAVEGPKSMDSILSELLDDVSIKDFLEAMMIMDKKYNDFIQKMVTNMKSLESSNMGLIVPQAVNPANYHVGSASAYYSVPGPHPLPMTPVASWQSQSNWQQPQIRGYKPPSPIRDYKNPTSSMPFTDFSQC